jgi:RNA polymerase sporulation-specific sigma factor
VLRHRRKGVVAFPDLCVGSQLVTAIKTATRQKHQPLNTFASLDKPLDEDGERTLLDVLALHPFDDSERFMVTQELSNDIRAALSEGLSELEARLFIGT